MNPTNSIECFQYRDRVRLSPRSIRLLQCCHYNPDTHEISCTLETFPIDECPAYYALSYTWGQALENDIGAERLENSLPACTLKIVDGTSQHTKFLEVGSNLSDFFLHLNDSRYRGERYPPSDTRLWIDAICINQSDQAEKEAQIMLMGDIYSKASHVIVWLGNGDSDLENFVWMQEIVWPALHRLLPSDQSIGPLESIQFANPLDSGFWTEHIEISRTSEQWADA